jgi:hypothetical protein
VTIEFVGHVYAMSTQASDYDVCIDLRVEGVRSLQNIKVNATKDEAAHYKPGMPVRIQIRPDFAPKTGTEPT